MTILRSILFNVAFYTNLIVQMLVQLPFYFFLSHQSAQKIPRNWARSNHWLMRVIVGTTYEIEGLENLPEGGFILAPKHQSTWDTYALIPYLADPVYILKRELLWIPLFGWFAAKLRMIPINRAAKGRSLAPMLERARQEMQAGRQLIIYPEGTRRPPGAPPEYKFGIARLYSALGVPVVPIVMHPGLFWPRHKFIRHPGIIKIRILPPVRPGMETVAFFAHLIEVTETASDQLLIDTLAANPHLPVPPSAKDRLDQRGLEQKQPRVISKERRRR